VRVVAIDAVAKKYQVSDPLGSTTPARVAEAVPTAVAGAGLGASAAGGPSRPARHRRQADEGGVISGA
jgi:hypothetical protein